MKTYKGKKVRLDKFEWERSKGNDPKVKKFFLYEGYASIDDGEPHGIGKMTEIDDTTDKDRFLENLSCLYNNVCLKSLACKAIIVINNIKIFFISILLFFSQLYT